VKRTSLSLPEIGLIAGTRAMLGAGAGLLLADRLRGEHRRCAGWALLLIGVASTIPLVMHVLRRRQ
jgi:hypothetical protein